MIEVAVILLAAFGAMLAMNVPISVGIALASWLAILATGGDASYMVAMRMAHGIDSFALLAIPFFILAGNLMARGGMAGRLLDLAAVLVGPLPGGLAQVATLGCMLFGSISGSAVAAVSSVGGFLIPEMKRKGYDGAFSVAVTTTAATTGLLIPPSNIMIVYATASGSVSIAALFMAGLLPGILTGIALMVAAAIVATRRGYPRAPWAGWPAFRRATLRALPSLMLIVLVLGGILSGAFTATEAAAVAVLYAAVLEVGIYRYIKPAAIPGLLVESGISTAVVMFLIGSCSGLAWILTTQNIPQQLSAGLLRLSSDPATILVCINLLLLLVGTVMDMTPAVLIFTPILLPVIQSWGMDPVHFGIVLVANLCIGLCTPPVGACLFVGCGLGRVGIERVAVAMIPFFLAMLVALCCINASPALSLWLPTLLGL